jgi:hypothetical protein
MMEEVLYQLLLISLDFIEQGPIVQIKSAGRKKRFCMIEIKIDWDGPLVIMVNSFPRLKFWLLQSRIIKRDYYW